MQKKFPGEALDERWHALPDFVEGYDSEADTLRHIKRVNSLLLQVVRKLLERAECHDDSKLSGNEKPYFDKFTPMLSASNYGTPEYYAMLELIQPALDNHYRENSHHPQYYKAGIDEMDLLDIVEMFCDWKAASERHDTGNIYNSIEHARARFSMSDQLALVFINTARNMGFKK